MAEIVRQCISCIDSLIEQLPLVPLLDSRMDTFKKVLSSIRHSINEFKVNEISSENLLLLQKDLFDFIPILQQLTSSTPYLFAKTPQTASLLEQKNVKHTNKLVEEIIMIYNARTGSMSFDAVLGHLKHTLGLLFPSSSGSFSLFSSLCSEEERKINADEDGKQLIKNIRISFSTSRPVPRFSTEQVKLFKQVQAVILEHEAIMFKIGEFLAFLSEPLENLVYSLIISSEKDDKFLNLSSFSPREWKITRLKDGQFGQILLLEDRNRKKSVVKPLISGSELKIKEKIELRKNLIKWKVNLNHENLLNLMDIFVSNEDSNDWLLNLEYVARKRTLEDFLYPETTVRVLREKRESLKRDTDETQTTKVEKKKSFKVTGLRNKLKKGISLTLGNSNSTDFNLRDPEQGEPSVFKKKSSRKKNKESERMKDLEEECIFYVNDQLREQLLSGIIKGLAYLHSNNINHKCLEPSNVLVSLSTSPSSSSHLKVKLKGFELFENESFKIKGRRDKYFPYQSPEVFQDSNNFTLYSDIYSFAILGWEVHQFRKKPFEDCLFDENKIREQVVEFQQRPEWKGKGSEKKEKNEEGEDSWIRNIIEHSWLPQPYLRPSSEDIKNLFSINMNIKRLKVIKLAKEVKKQEKEEVELFVGDSGSEFDLDYESIFADMNSFQEEHELIESLSILLSKVKADSSSSSKRLERNVKEEICDFNNFIFKKKNITLTYLYVCILSRLLSTSADILLFTKNFIEQQLYSLLLSDFNDAEEEGEESKKRLIKLFSLNMLNVLVDQPFKERNIDSLENIISTLYKTYQHSVFRSSNQAARDSEQVKVDILFMNHLFTLYMKLTKNRIFTQEINSIDSLALIHHLSSFHVSDTQQQQNQQQLLLTLLKLTYYQYKANILTNQTLYKYKSFIFAFLYSSSFDNNGSDSLRRGFIKLGLKFLNKILSKAFTALVEELMTNDLLLNLINILIRDITDAEITKSVWKVVENLAKNKMINRKAIDKLNDEFKEVITKSSATSADKLNNKNRVIVFVMMFKYFIDYTNDISLFYSLKLINQGNQSGRSSQRDVLETNKKESERVEYRLVDNVMKVIKVYSEYKQVVLESLLLFHSLFDLPYKPQALNQTSKLSPFVTDDLFYTSDIKSLLVSDGIENVRRKININENYLVSYFLCLSSDAIIRERGEVLKTFNLLFTKYQHHFSIVEVLFYLLTLVSVYGLESNKDIIKQGNIDQTNILFYTESVSQVRPEEKVSVGKDLIKNILETMLLHKEVENITIKGLLLIKSLAKLEELGHDQELLELIWNSDLLKEESPREIDILRNDVLFVSKSKKLHEPLTSINKRIANRLFEKGIGDQDGEAIAENMNKMNRKKHILIEYDILKLVMIVTSTYLNQLKAKDHRKGEKVVNGNVIKIFRIVFDILKHFSHSDKARRRVIKRGGVQLALKMLRLHLPQFVKSSQVENVAADVKRNDEIQKLYSSTFLLLERLVCPFDIKAKHQQYINDYESRELKKPCLLFLFDDQTQFQQISIATAKLPTSSVINVDIANHILHIISEYCRHQGDSIDGEIWEEQEDKSKLGKMVVSSGLLMLRSCCMINYGVLNHLRARQIEIKDFTTLLAWIVTEQSEYNRKYNLGANSSITGGGGSSVGSRLSGRLSRKLFNNLKKTMRSSRSTRQTRGEHEENDNALDVGATL